MYRGRLHHLGMAEHNLTIILLTSHQCYGIWHTPLIGIFSMQTLRSLLHLDHSAASVGLFTSVKTRLPKTVDNRLSSHIPILLSYQSPIPLAPFLSLS